MARNIEIKARINHLAEFESRAEAISGDTFLHWAGFVG